jgi:Zn-dependent protease with chaperone function
VTPVALAGVIALATFAACIVTTRIAIRPVERAMVDLARTRRCSAIDLLALRLLPLGIACLTVFIFVLPAFALFEPRGLEESAGVPMLAAAVVGAVLLTAAVWRAIRDLRATRRLVRGWLKRARPVTWVDANAFAVDTPEPLVAVAGILRTRIFLSERVLAACEPAEIAAVVAHERGHLRAADNFKRLLLRACPGALRVGSHDRAVEHAWSVVTEDAADAFAIRRGVGGLDLASALVAIVRLGPAPPLDAPLSLFHEGDDLERRVRRAMDPNDPPESPLALGVLRGAVLGLPLAALVMAAIPGTLHAVHQFVERGVAFLR